MANTRWEQAELERSRERGAWDRWGVQDAELRDDWVWFAFAQRRIYAPLEHLELPHHFSRVATHDVALLPFVQQYGRLGWHETKMLNNAGARASDPWYRTTKSKYLSLVEKHQEKAIYAEPREWIQAHARTVSWCLAAGHALRLSGTRARTQRCTELSHELPRPMGCRDTVRPALVREGTIENQSPIDFVGGMLEEYLWINLQGVRRRVQYVGGRVRSLWGGNSLVESIYTLVTDAVTGGRLAQCQATDCGAIFLQTDERQQFCPPREGQDKSTCMNRERVRRYRRIRKGSQHGKTTRTR